VVECTTGSRGEVLRGNETYDKRLMVVAVVVMMIIIIIIIILSWVSVTVAWCVLMLRMEGSYDCIE
jgi:hypothetical protein